jgi:hypothetical protein
LTGAVSKYFKKSGNNIVLNDEGVKKFGSYYIFTEYDDPDISELKGYYIIDGKLVKSNTSTAKNFRKSNR